MDFNLLTKKKEKDFYKKYDALVFKEKKFQSEKMYYMIILML